MEKIVYALWCREGQSRAALNRTFQDEVVPKLGGLVQSIRLNLQDDAVVGATSPRMQMAGPPIDAVAQLWVDSALDPARAAIDDVIADATGRFEAWLVVESTVLPNIQHPPHAGGRTEGFSQIVFLGRPDGLDHAGWRDAWQRLHTGIAVETRANFEYRQNLIVRPLTENSTAFVAMVEECFPIEALTDEAVYFDAVDDAEKLARNREEMARNCARFIDFERIVCFPTSQYDVLPSRMWIDPQAIVRSDRIEIEASAQIVWDILVDLPRYGEWNPFCFEATSTLEVGAPVHMKLNSYTEPGEILPNCEFVCAFDAPHSLSWELPWSEAWPYPARRDQIVEALGPDRCAYQSTDAFLGEHGIHVMRFAGAWVKRAFDDTGRALKLRAEAFASGASA